ncbi:MAG: indole-3-glycerol-phosphate synthase TrpC, partial [Candidatus Latescibacterota bacterium]|nr:indole-3-glycerol-phosphate synthase TrpC [Candidatus Latescibacterota bacterium]
VALMDGGQLEDLQGLGRDLGLSVLVEVHTREELERALGAGAGLIGINNRDLKTFETSLETTFELREHVPETVTLVSESGIRDHDDVRQLTEAGIDAILVGESLMREQDIGMAVQRLLNG